MSSPPITPINNRTGCKCEGRCKCCDAPQRPSRYLNVDITALGGTNLFPGLFPDINNNNGSVSTPTKNNSDIRICPFAPIKKRKF